MSKIGINGFGRIGRTVLRRLLETQDSNTVVAINDLTSPKVRPICSGMILIRRLPVERGFYRRRADWTVKPSRCTPRKRPDISRESRWGGYRRGMHRFYTSEEKSRAHLDAGAKKS